MRHLKKGRTLNRTPSHRKAMFANMATSLLMHEKIQTTDAKAKEIRGYTERLITLGKKGDLASRRKAFETVRDQAVLAKLFNELGPRFANRPGGFTRVMKSGIRKGDNAPLSIVEILSAEVSKPAPVAEPVVVSEEKSEEAVA